MKTKVVQGEIRIIDFRRNDKYSGTLGSGSFRENLLRVFWNVGVSTKCYKGDETFRTKLDCETFTI